MGEKKHFQLDEYATVSLAGAHSWRAIPGPALNAPGTKTTLTTPHSYDWLVIDPRASDLVFRTLRRQLHCPVPEPDPEMHPTRMRVRDCLSSGSIRWGVEDYRFEFALPG